MAFPFPPDLQQFVRDRMASEEEEDVAAVREAVAQWQAGDPGVPLDEAVDTVRRKHGIPNDA